MCAPTLRPSHLRSAARAAFSSLAGVMAAASLAHAQDMVRDSQGALRAIVPERSSSSAPALEQTPSARRQASAATPRSLAAISSPEPDPTPADSASASTPERIVINGEAADAPLAPYAGGQVAEGGRLGLLGDRGVFDTPFSTTNYTAELVKNQQARTVSDLLLNDPSVNTQWPRGTFTERYQIRGFTVSGDEAALNGLFGIVPGLLTLPEAFERVELFKGPNALLNGKVGSVGGSINYVTKRAGDRPNASLTSTYASTGQFGAQADVGRRFGQNGEFGIRVNGSYADGDTEGDFQGQRLALAALGVDYRRQGFRLSGDLIYQDTLNHAPRSQVYTDDSLPYLRPPDAHRSYQQPWEFGGGNDLIGMLRGELDVTRDITLYAAAGGRRGYERQSRDIPILINGVFDARKGDFGAFPDYDHSWSDADSELAGARGRFSLGPTTHELSLSANRLHTTSGDLDVTLFDDVANPNGLLDNLYHPASRPRPVFPNIPRRPPKSNANTESSVALADIVSVFEGRAQVIVGGRLQRVEAFGFDQETGQKTQSYDESKLTPAYTLLVKPIQRLSLYGSYIQALEQGPVAPEGTVNRGEIFPPNDTTQYEAGAKLDLGRFGVTLAWFQITQPFGQTVANGPGLPRFTVDGEQRNRGVELSLFGEPWKGVRLLGGVTYLDPTLRKTEGGLFDGRKAPGNSDFVVNVNGEYDLPFLPGLTLTGRVAYQTEQYVNNANTVEIPDWTRVDLGARYARRFCGRLTTLRVGCENVADKNYWASAANGYLLAQPRTFLTSLTVDF